MARYITSDQHFGHYNIINYTKRPYKTVDEMNETLIDNYNKIISNDDICCFLGDFAWGNTTMVKNILAQLNGYKILILSYHDKHKPRKFWHEVGFDDVINGSIIWDKNFILSHEPVDFSLGDGFVNIHGHLHTKELQDERYYNACVELNQYQPVSFDSIKSLYLIEEMEIEETE